MKGRRKRDRKEGMLDGLKAIRMVMLSRAIKRLESVVVDLMGFSLTAGSMMKRMKKSKAGEKEIYISPDKKT